MGFGNTQQGTYIVKNKDKYIGEKDPRYLSSWELHVFKYLDENINVIKWGSECIVVKYFSPADNKMRRYMTDVYCEYKDKQGKVVKDLIEIKPYSQTRPPQKGRKKQETYLRECYTYEVNKAKWLAALAYAKERNMRFRVLTERDLFNW